MPKIAKELSPLEVSRLDKTGFQRGWRRSGTWFTNPRTSTVLDIAG